jgi:hypothetical protein
MSMRRPNRLELSAIAVIVGTATALLALVILVAWLVIAELEGGAFVKASASAGVLA